jgi:hypothetical protein
VTATVPFPPNVPIDADVEEIANAHGGAVAESCRTVNNCPPMTTVPCRCTPAFAATTICTLAEPAPDRGVTVSHESLVSADHEQPAGAVMATVLVPPDAGTCALVGALAMEHCVVLAS